MRKKRQIEIRKEEKKDNPRAKKKDSEIKKPSFKVQERDHKKGFRGVR